MKTLQVNIGLNNNSKTIDSLILYLATLTGYRLMGYYQTEKQYKGETEPTFVAIFEYKYARQSKILTDWENIASVLNQDCIAISTDYFEALAFNPSYNWEAFRFDSNQFEYMKLNILVDERDN